MIVRYGVRLVDGSEMVLRDDKTIDEKFHHIMRKKHHKRSWLKIEENCRGV
jgi:hypothetical protein